MIDSYLQDEIDIVTQSYNEWGAIDSNSTSRIPAHIQDDNRVVTDVNGKEVVGNATIFINASQAITYTDMIRLKKRNGVNVDINDKKFPILRLAKLHGFTTEYWEITI